MGLQWLTQRCHRAGTHTQKRIHLCELWNRESFSGCVGQWSADADVAILVWNMQRSKAQNKRIQVNQEDKKVKTQTHTTKYISSTWQGTHTSLAKILRWNIPAVYAAYGHICLLWLWGMMDYQCASGCSLNSLPCEPESACMTRHTKKHIMKI